MVSIIIPTLNEEDAIQKILLDIEKNVQGRFVVEVIIVDDASTDNTVKIISELAKKMTIPVRTIVRKERGLATAVLFGMKFARGESYLVMDADGSHPASVVPQMLDALQRGADLVIGSRHIKGGGVEEWPLHRRLYSRAAALFARPLSHGVSDPLSGLFAIKKNCLEGVELSPVGYKILLECLVKADCKTCREIPYLFTNREVGSSKLTKKIALQYFVHLAKLYAYNIKKRVPNKISQKSVMSWLGALVFTGILCIPVVEWGFAKFIKPRYYIFPQGMYENVAGRCYEFAKNFSGTITTEEYSTSFITNTQGLRYREVTYEKPKEVRRILAVGDSFVPQFTVAAEETFLSRIERELSQKNTTQIIPLGVNGYNTAQERMYLEEEGMKYKPDGIAIFFYDNDFADTANFVSQPKSNCVRDGVLYSGSSESQSLLAQKLPGVNFLWLKVKGIWEVNRTDAENINRYTNSFNEENEKNTLAVVQEIRAMKKIADDNKIPLVVFIIPHKNAVYEKTAEGIDYQAVSKRLVKELKKYNIAAFDTTEDMRASAAVDNRRLYFMQDDHLTPYGNEVFSYIIRGEMEKIVK